MLPLAPKTKKPKVCLYSGKLCSAKALITESTQCEADYCRIVKSIKTHINVLAVNEKCVQFIGYIGQRSGNKDYYS